MAHHADIEILREHGLGVIAETAAEAHSFDFRFADSAYPGTAFVGESLTHVHKDVSGAFMEGVTFYAAAWSRGYFRKNVISSETVGIIAGFGLLFRVFAAILTVVYHQGAGSGHYHHRAEFGAADSAEINVRIAGEIAVVAAVWGAPPAGVLVEGVQLRTRDVERRYAHHPGGAHGTGIGGAEVARSHEGLHIACERLCGQIHG